MQALNPENGLHFFSVAAMAVVLSVVVAKADDVQSAVSAGQSAPAFQARTVDGETVNFPGDYKGKVVLLDFWATWCGPCRQELPNVVATYQKFHAYGFDALSVSLDEPRNGPALLQFVQNNNMSWPQIYDGRYWKAAVALEYGIKSIPCPILVDGDTGKIIALSDDVRGERLPLQVEKALQAKGKQLPRRMPYNPNAPDKLTMVINGQTVTAWRTGQLKNAEAQARSEHKPIAWILSNPDYLDGTGQISSENSRGATVHVLYAFRDRAVLVFQDPYTEHHSVLPSVHEAVNALAAGWTTPLVMLLDPDGAHVLATIPFEPDFVKRAHALANALGEAEAKMNVPPSAANK
jgi:peroxiredoxin